MRLALVTVLDAGDALDHPEGVLRVVNVGRADEHVVLPPEALERRVLGRDRATVPVSGCDIERPRDAASVIFHLPLALALS